MMSLRNVSIVDCGTGISVPKGELQHFDVVGLTISSCAVGIEERDEPQSTHLSVEGVEVMIPGVWSQSDITEFVRSIREAEGKPELVARATKIGRAWSVVAGGAAFADSVLSVYGALTG